MVYNIFRLLVYATDDCTYFQHGSIVIVTGVVRERHCRIGER